MWHEARKQERMIRGLIVDYRRRAERRKDFYEKIKAEPTQFLQLHGRPCKIHLDPAIAAAGESAAIMMPWQGDSNNMIDRFDVRAHLDFIPEVKYPDIPPEELSPEERQCNYERYRILAQNNFLGITEDKFLRQLAIEEQYGVTIEEKEMQKEKLLEKKGTGVAIGYNYSDPGAQPSGSNGPEVQKIEQKDSDDDSDLEIIDVDLSIDVNKMEASQAHSLNAVGPSWGMAGCDLFSFLTGDADDAEQQKQLLREEKEKAMFSGRKSRRERRAHRDKKLAARVASPPSYAAPRAPASPAPPPRARSPSPPPPPASIQFITSFGPEDEDKPPPKPLYAEKVKQNLRKGPLYSEVARKPKSRSPARPMGPFGPPPAPPRSRSRTTSSSRSKSRSRSRSRPTSRSRSRSRSTSQSRSRSHSPRRNYRRRSRSPQNHGYSKRNRSRSMSFERSRPGPARYYGRRAEDKSSSELSLDSASSDSADDINNKSAVANKSNSNQNQIRSGTSSKGSPRGAVSLKEKLKRKMQAQLSRQLRADQRAEALRLERESRRQARRDQEMRDLAIKLRRKQREMRHQRNRRSSEEDSDRSRSRSSSGGSQNDERKKGRSRSASPSPSEKRIPVWESEREFATVPFRPKPPEGDSSSYQRRRFENETYDRHPREQTHEPRPYEARPYESRPYESRPHEPRPYEPRPYEPRPYEARTQEGAYEQRGDSGRGFPRRRPFRGGYRGQGYRHGPEPPAPPERAGGGPPAPGQRAPRPRVKLVDY